MLGDRLTGLRQRTGRHGRRIGDFHVRRQCLGQAGAQRGAVGEQHGAGRGR